MKLPLLTYGLTICMSYPAFSQQKVTDGFTRTSKGLFYKIVTDAKKPKGHVGDIIKMNAVYATQNDSLLFSTHEGGMGPVQFTINNPSFNGDPMEGFALLGEGDSAIFLMPADSAYKDQKEYPPFAKPGDFVKISVSVLSLMSKQEYEAKKQAEAKVKMEAESKTIDEYLTKKGLKAQKTPSGLYYIIEQQGTGAKAEAGKTVTVKYTGKLLDGKVFESSSYTFLLGAGKAIKGWDEGIPLFNVGGRGMLIIPSPMGYGERGSGQIPPNSILVFDIELMEVK